MTLRRAWLVHFAAALLGVLLLALLVSWESIPGPASVASVGRHVVANVVWLVDETARNPKTYVLTILGIALLIEAGFTGVAYLIMPWGAGDEPLGASYRHAFRRVWLQTPHVLWIILVIGVIAVSLERIERTWNPVYSQNTPPVPTLPEDATLGSPAWDEYNTRMKEYWIEVGRNYRQGQAQQPWYIRFNEGIAIDLGFLSSLWVLWALLRSAGAPRVVPSIERPPQCDACGYNLTSIPLESRCPECGAPVEASLGPKARPGTPWQRREVGWPRAWWRSWVQASRDPMRFGRTLRLIAPGVDHRRFLAMHLPLVFLIGALSPPAFFVAVEGRSPIPKNIEVLIIGAPIFGALCTVGAIMFSLLSALAAGVGFHYRERRNLLVGAVQVVSYLFPYLLVWQFFGAVTGITAASMSHSEWFERLTLSRRVGPEVLAFFMWLIPNLACGIWYWTLVKRAVAGTRYANR